MGGGQDSELKVAAPSRITVFFKGKVAFQMASFGSVGLKVQGPIARSGPF
jgi:hypothetical protein